MVLIKVKCLGNIVSVLIQYFLSPRVLAPQYIVANLSPKIISSHFSSEMYPLSANIVSVLIGNTFLSPRALAPQCKLQISLLK